MIKKLRCDSEPIAKMYIADTFFGRLSGYMFRKEPHHEALMFQPCNSIHTFFMKFNIDVLFLDENMEIIKKVEDLPPRRIIMPIKGSSIVIEGKAGIFRNCKVGVRLSI